MNNITIMGDPRYYPETHYTASGKKVTNFPIATNYRANGEEGTLWYCVAVWGDAFDNLTHLYVETVEKWRKICMDISEGREPSEESFTPSGHQGPTPGKRPPEHGKGPGMIKI